jgi:16S rRNA (guanine966-N2)-methyltransferase
MNLRIIAGEFRRRIIKSPGSRQTHPMGERIRAAIFNKIVNYLPNASVLDTFAGTGALGLEALSRGAREVTLVEKDRKAQKIIVGNIEALNVEQRTKLIRANVSGWLNTMLAGTSPNKLPKYDIIFADPPYWNPQFNIVERLSVVLKDKGVLILSHTKAIDTPKLKGLELLDRREYADAVIAYYAHDDEA